jgi:hypothetical protein
MPGQLADDAAARKAVHVEIDDELARTVPIIVDGQVDAELRSRRT